MERHDYNKDFSELISDCENEMISKFCNDDSRNKELVKEFYMSNFMAHKSIPALEDIMCDVWQHNSEQIWRIGSYQYEVEGWGGYDDDSETSLCNREYTIGDLCSPWEEYYSDSFYGNLENYVEDFLEEMNLSYCYEDVSDHYCDSNHFSSKRFDPKSVTIFLNDCQNILFYDFLKCTEDGAGRILFVVSGGYSR